MSFAPRGEHWTAPGIAEAYEASYATLNAGTAPALLDDLAPDGRSLLDVGCGTGLLAAAAVERGLRVTVCEPDPAMLLVARKRLGDGVRAITSRLPQLLLPGGMYDRVVANFVIDHVDDPRASVEELGRMCGPGGLVAVTGFLDEMDTQRAFFATVYADSGAALPETLHAAAETHGFPRTLDGWRGLIESSTLDVVKAELVEWVWRIDPEQVWRGISAGVGSLGVAYLAAAPDVQARMREAYLANVADHLDGTDLVLPSRAAYVLARQS